MYQNYSFTEYPFVRGERRIKEAEHSLHLSRRFRMEGHELYGLGFLRVTPP